LIDDGEVRCGACETALPVKDDVFLCRACMDKLPGNLRHDVLNVEEQYQYGARKRALEALGVDLEGLGKADVEDQIKDLHRKLWDAYRTNDSEAIDALREKIDTLKALFSEQRRINLKPERKPRQMKCRCKKPFLMKTDGLFGGTEDVCGNCARPIVRARRVMA
jgi:hypothetical protein